jgi:hypothetical protein
VVSLNPDPVVRPDGFQNKLKIFLIVSGICEKFHLATRKSGVEGMVSKPEALAELAL